MLVAITGGTGFIGRKLVMRLADSGVQVRVFTRHNTDAFKDLPQVELCLCDLVSLKQKELSSMLDGVDVLYHCAGQLTNIAKMRALHVDATSKLLEAAAGRIGHWVQLSSVGVYGQFDKGEVTEDYPLNPVGEYETTKAEADQIVMNVSGENSFSYTILRPANVFGAEMTNQSLFAMMRMIECGLFCFIGRPGALVKYIHVDNVIEGLVRCGTMPQAKDKIYNLSDHCTLEHLVAVIATNFGCKAPRLRIPYSIAYAMGKILGWLPGFPLTLSRIAALVNRSSYPISRLQNELNYYHVISIENGLQELVQAYKYSKQRG